MILTVKGHWRIHHAKCATECRERMSMVYLADPYMKIDEHRSSDDYRALQVRYNWHLDQIVRMDREALER